MDSDHADGSRNRTPGEAGQAADTSAGCAPDGADPAATFARELRALREQAGSPSFRQLARQTHFSASTLAEATAGRRLPTEQVVRALAQACGEDPDRWAIHLNTAASRSAAAATASTSAATPPSAPALGQAGPRQSRRLPRGTRLAAEIVAAAGCVGLGLAVAPGTAPSHAPSPAAAARPAATYPAHDGADPVTAGCAADAKLIDKAPIEQDGTQVGAVELRFSARCAAGWGRVYLYPAGVAAGLSRSLASITVTAADGTASSYTGQADHQTYYTDVIAPHGGCLGVTATLSAGPIRLSARIPCEQVG